MKLSRFLVILIKKIILIQRAAFGGFGFEVLSEGWKDGSHSRWKMHGSRLS